MVKGMTTSKEKIYELGKEQGRKEILRRLYAALDLEELIAEAVARHEEIYHNDTP